MSFLKEIPKNRYLGIFNKDYKNMGFIGYNPSYNWPKICEKQSVIFLDFIDNKMNINNYYSRKIYDNLDYTYNLYNPLFTIKKSNIIYNYNINNINYNLIYLKLLFIISIFYTDTILDFDYIKENISKLSNLTP